MKKNKKLLAASTILSLVIGAGQSQSAPPPYEVPPIQMDFLNGRSGSSVDTDGGGNIYVATTSTVDNGSILKYSSAGELLWERKFDGANKNPSSGTTYYETEGISGVAVDANGNVYATGEVYTPATRLDCALKKFDANGNLLWTRTFDYSTVYNTAPSTHELCNDIIIDYSGNIITAGLNAASDPNRYENLIIKWSPHGGILNVNISYSPKKVISDCAYAQPCMAQVTDVTVAPSGVITILGKYSSNARFAKNYTSGLGHTTQVVNYVPASKFIPQDITADWSGNIFVGGGESRTENSVTDMYHKVISYSPDFKKTRCENVQIYSKYSYYHDQYDHIWGMTLGPDGHIYATGSEGGGINTQMMAMKYDSSCLPQWTDAEGKAMPLMHGVVSSQDRGYDIAVDEAGNVIMTGIRGYAPNATTEKFIRMP